MTAPQIIPAATLILLRDGEDGSPPDLIMLERAGSMAFAPGAMVFPGGRIDPGDRDAAGTLGPDSDLPARIAAIRETIEEVGIAIGLHPAPCPATLARLRAGLAAGIPFATLLANHGLQLRPDSLVPFARWCPNFPETRSFDTHFFLALAPTDAEPTPDGAEAVAALWTTAAAMLADAEAGRRHLIFPTRRNLERLGRCADPADAIAQARAFPVRCITPWTEERTDGRWLCIPDDLGYPVTAERFDQVQRA